MPTPSKVPPPQGAGGVAYRSGTARALDAPAALIR